MVSWFLDVWFNFYLYKCISNFFSSILLLTSSWCLEENTNTACPQRITYLLPLICTWMASSCSFISCLLLEKPKNSSLSKGLTMQWGQSYRDKLYFVINIIAINIRVYLRHLSFIIVNILFFFGVGKEWLPWNIVNWNLTLEHCK